MKQDDKKIIYPKPYLEQDDRSIRGQKNFKKGLGTTLALLCVVVIVSKLPIQPSLQSLFIAVIFGFQLAKYQLSKRLNSKKSWYYGRAIAESIKTLTWKYMMNVPIELSDLKRQESSINPSNTLADKINELVSLEKKSIEFRAKDKPSFSKKSDIESLQQLNFNDIRSISDISTKIDLYKRYRLQDQYEWYYTKSNKNAKTAQFFDRLIALLSFIGVCSSLICLFEYCPDSNQLHLIPYVPILSVLITSILSWTQLNQYDMLAYSYGVASDEIYQLIETLDRNREFISNETELAKFVDDAENVFSREHVFWIARNDSYKLGRIRDNPIKPS